MESFSISSPTLEDIFLAIVYEADSDPDNIIKKKKVAKKEKISPGKCEDEESYTYTDLSTDGQSTSSFPISTLRPNIAPTYSSGLNFYSNQATTLNWTSDRVHLLVA